MTITSDIFSTLGRSVAQHHGMPEVPFVVVPHPVALRSSTEIQELADRLVDDIVAALVSGGPS